MPNCYEKNITISQKLATLASGQFLLMIHRQTDAQTQRQPTYMADFILPCNVIVRRATIVSNHKHSAHFNIVLLNLSKNYNASDYNNMESEYIFYT